jgi:hypothetical protein
MISSERFKKYAAITLLAVFPHGTLTRPAPKPPPKFQEVTYTAVDFSYNGPDTLPGGWTRVHVKNSGKDLHHILFVQLKDGKSQADFEAALKADPMLAKPPSWIRFAGGPNAIIPGEAGTALINLEPGNYLLICVVPDPKGVLHVAQGMIKPVTVTESKKSTAAPKAARRIELNNFSYTIPKPLTAGKQIIEVVNKGSQDHELVLVQLPPNHTIMDFGRHFMPDAPTAGGPLPGKPIGGIVGLGPGEHAYFYADLAPGRYGLICFWPDTAGDRHPHFTKGMMADFTIP